MLIHQTLGVDPPNRVLIPPLDGAAGISKLNDIVGSAVPGGKIVQTPLNVSRTKVLRRILNQHNLLLVNEPNHRDGAAGCWRRSEMGEQTIAAAAA